MKLTIFFIVSLLSISLFEAYLIIILGYSLYRFYKQRLSPGGSLLVPLTTHALVVFLSTLLYYPSQIGKAVERGVFLLAYSYGDHLKLDEGQLRRFNLVLIYAGLLLLPVVFYKFFKTGMPAMLWGGWFEVGALYTIFATASLSFVFYRRKLAYLIPFLIFVGIVFFTMRRSAMLGLAFSLLAFALISASRISRRALTGILLTLLLGFVVSSAILIKRDVRYQALFEVVTAQRSLNDEMLNLISSYRWEIAKAGLEVVKKDLREGNILPLLIGHGINSGYYLEPKSPVGGVYESFFLLSEFIEKGAVGLFAVLWVYFTYLKILLGFKVRHQKDYLLLPLLLALGSHLIATIFTFFWDALLPLYLLLFRVVERLRSEPSTDAPYPQGR